MKSLRSHVSTSNLADTKASLAELQKMHSEAAQAITELQEAQTAEIQTDTDGLPANEAKCLSINGQFLRLTQDSAAPSIVKAKHSLGRIPVGAIFIQTTGINKTFAGGDITQNISPATTTTVSFELNGSIGEEHICILI